MHINNLQQRFPQSVGIIINTSKIPTAQMDVLLLHSKSNYGHYYYMRGPTKLNHEDTPCNAGWLLGTTGLESLTDLENVFQAVTNSRVCLTFENIETLRPNAVNIRAIKVYTTTRALRSTQKHMKKLFPIVDFTELGYYWSFLTRSTEYVSEKDIMDDLEMYRNQQFLFYVH